MSDGKYGQKGTFDDLTDFAVISFIIKQALGMVRTALPVQVIAVHGGGVGAPPTVDVQPTINMIDSQGNKTPHGTIFGIPCMRIQGGAFSIIIDPVVDDYGLMLVSDRDLSALKANVGAISNPGSFRRHNLADGVYVGAILNAAAPTQYLQIKPSGVTIKDAHGNLIVTSAAGINLNGVVIDSSGNISTPGGVIAGHGGGDQVGLQSHIHGSGPPPNPGS